MGDAPALHHRSPGAPPPPRQARASEQCNDDHTLSSGTRAKPAARTHALLQWATRGDRGITYAYRGTYAQSGSASLQWRASTSRGEGPSRRVWTPAVRLPPGALGTNSRTTYKPAARELACMSKIGEGKKKPTPTLGCTLFDILAPDIDRFLRYYIS